MTELASQLDALTLEAANAATQAARKAKPDHPKGWEPGVAFDGNKGTVTSGPLDNAEPEWDGLLKSWGFDPALYRVLDPVQVRTYEMAMGEGETKQVWYYRASIEAKRDGTKDLDLDELRGIISRCKPRKSVPSGDSVFVACIADVQMGKADGDGVEGTIQRFVDGIEAVKKRYTDLRKIGRTFSTLVVFEGGDSVEGCYGNYPGQIFTVELNQRDQEKVFRRLFTQALKTWAPDFEKVVVLGVPSNHTENRQNGKKATDDADDAGLANLECIAEILKENPAFNHVSFVIPSGEMVVTLDLEGTTVSFTHAHKANGGGLPQAKLKTWWANQAFGNQPAGDADVLVSAHYHHFSVIDHGPRLHLQCPSLDGESKWYRDSNGVDARSGLLTFTTSKGLTRDIEVV